MYNVQVWQKVFPEFIYRF